MTQVIPLDDFCASKSCEHYREWSFSDGDNEQPYTCWSCELVGQSYHIMKMPNSCPHMVEAMKYYAAQREGVQ